MFVNIAGYKSAYFWVYLLNAKLWVRSKAKLEMHISSMLIFGYQWFCLISFSSEEFEFYKYKMYLDMEIVALFMLLHNSKFNKFLEYCARCHFLVLSWFYNYNFIDIWWLVDISPCKVALMITYSLKCKWKKWREEIEKKRKRNLVFHFQATKLGS